MPASGFFTPRTLSFLRALKRNNDREWFKARKDDYETHVRGPMVALVERLAEDARAFAPDLVIAPRDSIFRIYRDTRFSEDKSPLKTHIAATFRPRSLPKHRGAGLYVQVGIEGAWAGGGIYAPETSDLLNIREHLAANYQRFRAIVESPRFKQRLGTLQGERLQRVPRGFPADHPAAEYFKFKQLYAGRDFSPAETTSPRFYQSLLTTFKDMMPLVAFLNEALRGGATKMAPAASRRAARA